MITFYGSLYMNYRYAPQPLDYVFKGKGLVLTLIFQNTSCNLSPQKIPIEVKFILF